MFYYMVQSHTSSFPIGLVKDESESIVGPVETDLVRLTLVVAVLVWMLILFFLAFCET